MTFADIVNNIVSFINNSVIPLLYAVAFVAFIYGVFKFYFTGGEENRQKGRAFVMWGLIGFVVLFSIWGLVKLLLPVVTG